MKKLIFIVLTIIFAAVLFVGCEAGDRRNPLVNTPGNDRFDNYGNGNNNNRNRNDFYDPDVNPFVRTPEVRNPLITPNVPNNYPNGNMRQQKRQPDSVNVRPGMDFIRKK